MRSRELLDLVWVPWHGRCFRVKVPSLLPSCSAPGLCPKAELTRLLMPGLTARKAPCLWSSLYPKCYQQFLSFCVTHSLRDKVAAILRLCQFYVI